MNRILLLLAGLLAQVTVAHGQTIAQRVASAPDGEVRISYAVRPGVCGNGENMVGTWRSGDGCVPGPARVALTVQSGRVTGLRHYVGGGWTAGSGRVTELGTVPPAEAASYLLALAETGEPEVARKAVFPATLAEGTSVWRELLRVARSPRAPERARSQAVFWLGQAAGDEVTRSLGQLVQDDGIDRSVQKQAVFALSQRPQAEGIPALIQVARTHRDAQIRKQALFWLGQSRDPRALALFEEILVRS
ncbi:MAG: HEAT repeat domain-containing protein [Gemmatimonadota bacterium]|nr:HEAT repeat domain-containing protein [Gemmatimonadota bacterium]